ncbi:hypothetical protein A8C56_07565 [Niabella ginsenosidivorans]|uniref:DUF3347 domain-containing protein n=1 Tax=Niabella ginsenosidivorans TaxID=1176587 RepID=A0A1A9HZL7_9BACT|nr:DUF3347 domain-containing protein [Niabella ginsenosidivorans]ANH80857.1 hypothetical protein A8C56_07565 [Niabella ginsenosidivorans]
MKKLLILVLMLAAAFLIYRFAFKKKRAPREKPVPVAVSEQSAGFNQSMNSILSSYYRMTEGFVNWDTAAVGSAATGLETALKQLNVEELKKDTTIYQTALYPLELAKTNTATIAAGRDWTERRHALNDLSDNIRTLLLTIKYDQAPVYWQECPMAFGEGESGDWLSSKAEIINPYLGNKDPKYGKSMLNCGENKMTIDFTKRDSARLK